MIDSTPRRTSAPRLSRAMLSLAFAGALLATVACGGDEQVAGRGGPPWGGGGGRPPAVVETASLEQGAFQVEAQFVGSLEAESAADLYARTSGQIVRLYADAGDRVRSGQLLAEIEPDEARQQVEQARAALRIAEATLAQREANLEVAEATSRRTEALFDQDLLSEQDRDTARAELVGARSQLELARAQIEQAKANLSAAQIELGKTRVTAPFDGYIGERYLDLGDLAGTNRPLFAVVDLDTIRTTVSLPERDAARIQPGQPATVSVESFPSERFDGRVSRIASVFDPETNTVEAQIEVDNPAARLKPGMFSTVRIAYRTEPTALLVPSAALVENPNETYLFVAERAEPGDGAAGPGGGGTGGPEGATGGPEGGPPAATWVARKIPVRVIGTAQTDSRAAIEPLAADAPGGAGGTDLAPGDLVIVLGQESLSDGAPVVLSSEMPRTAP